MTFPAAGEVWGAESVTNSGTDTCTWAYRPLGSPQAQCRGPSLRPLGKQRCLKGTQVTLTVPTTTSHHSLPFQALAVSTSLRLGPREWSCLISPTRVSSSVKGNENRTESSDCGRQRGVCKRPSWWPLGHGTLLSLILYLLALFTGFSRPEWQLHWSWALYP